MKKVRTFTNALSIARWARLTAFVSRKQQRDLQEICRYNGGKPGTIATELARIASTVEPREYADFLKSVRKAAERHARSAETASP